MEKIEFESNGIKCFYNSCYLDEPSILSIIAKELIEFQKVFFKNDKLSYLDVMSEEEIFDFFSRCKFLENEKHKIIKDILDKAYCEQNPLSFDEAYEIFKEQTENPYSISNNVIEDITFKQIKGLN